MNQSEINKSYATFGLTRSLRQAGHALRSRKHAEEGMAILLQMVREDEKRMVQKLGRPLQNMRILEIGPGQGMERARYFGIKNTVIGFDLDVIPMGFDLPVYWHMLRKNGFGRFAKTIGRKLLVGWANAAAWAKVVGADNMRDPQFIYGDICQAAPEVGTFDIVMSWSVFEHLPDPQKALFHVIEALKPGGLFYISLHLYTSNNGHHDIRAFTGREDLLPLWGHLRPSTQHLFHPSSYLNKWRLRQWRQLFTAMAPDHEEILVAHDHVDRYRSRMTAELRQELADYEDEELFTVDVIYLWQKPKQAM